MSRLRNTPGLAKVAVGVLLFAAATTACEEDTKTTPERCADSTEPYDIQATAAGSPDDNPCFTPIGHSVSSIGGSPTVTTGGSATSGSGGTGGSAGKGGTGGTAGSGGSSGKGGAGGSAGKGGAGGSAGKGGTSGSGGKGGNAGTGGK